TVSLVVAPVALDDDYGVQHDQDSNVEAIFGLLTNDSVASGAPMTASLVAGPSHGTLTLSSDGGFLYTPDAAYLGTDTFTYHVTDGTLSSDPATVTIEVRDQAPVAVDITYDVGENDLLPADPARNLVEWAAYDPDGEALTPILVSGPAHAASFTL